MPKLKLSSKLVATTLAIPLLTVSLQSQATGTKPPPAQNPTPVTVTNTTVPVSVTNTALPVTGNVGISNTVSVNVANVPTVRVDTTTPLVLKGQDIFNVPFGISSPYTPYAVNLLLQSPAILESITASCPAQFDALTIGIDDPKIGTPFPAQSSVTVLGASFGADVGVGGPILYPSLTFKMTDGLLPLTDVKLPVHSVIYLGFSVSSVVPYSYCTGFLTLRNLN